MKIIYLHQYFTTPDLGAGTRSWEFARRWADSGHEVHMVTSSMASGDGPHWSAKELSGFTVHTCNVPYSNGMSVTDRIQSFSRFAALSSLKTRQLGGDVVFATSTPLTIAVPAIVGTLGRSVPYVFEVRDLWPDVPIAMGYLRNPVLRKSALLLEHNAYRFARHIVAISPGIKSDIVAKGVPESKVSVVTHGCDPELFQSVDASDLAVRLPWVLDGPVVLYAGAIGKANGLGYLLEVAERMREVDPGVRFAVVGDGKERAELEARASADGTGGKTVFFLGRLSKGEVAKWFSVSAISLALLQGPRVMWKDAGQNKFFDSIAAGRPIAVNNDSWQSQVALKNNIGVRLSPDDPEAAAIQLSQALRNVTWLAEVEERCRQLWQGEFNRDLLANRALSILEGAADRR